MYTRAAFFLLLLPCSFYKTYGQDEIIKADSAINHQKKVIDRVRMSAQFDQFTFSPQKTIVNQWSLGAIIKNAEKKSTAITKLNIAQRGKDIGIQTFNEYYKNISKKDYVNAIFSVSNSVLYPSAILGVSNIYTPLKGMEVTMGIRSYFIKKDKRTLLLQTGIGYQLKKHFLSYDLYTIQKERYHFTHRFNYRFYFSEYAFFSFYYNTGKQQNIYYPRGINDLSVNDMEMQGISILLSLKLSAKWIAEIHYITEKYIDPYSRQGFNIRVPGIVITKII